MDTIRTEVVDTMSNSRVLSVLKKDNWYEVEDELVTLCEKISDTKDCTYASVEKIDTITKKDIMDWILESRNLTNKFNQYFGTHLIGTDEGEDDENI